MKKTSLIPIGKLRMPISKLLFLVLLLPCFLYADCKRPPLLSLGVGTFDTLRPHQRMLQFQAEYKWRPSWHGVQPITGIMFTEKGSVYVCAGACYDIFLKKYFVVTPSFAPGIYFQKWRKGARVPP